MDGHGVQPRDDDCHDVGRYGLRTFTAKLYLGGIVLFTAASGACGMASSLEVLNLAHTVQWVAAATVNVTSRQEERALDRLFASRTVSSESLGKALTRIGRLQGQVRQVT